MTVLELRFPAGRYHATPWGRHVNEGAVEWPPSPWRILRALIATWYLKAKGEIAEPVMRGLVEKLSSPPRFHLPRASTSHTRHYMPYNEGKNEKTTKIFDTFVQLEPGAALLAAWDVDLLPAELAVLRILTRRLGYLGRAEALLEACVTEGVAAIECNSHPLAEGDHPSEKQELVRLLSPMGPADYELWRQRWLAVRPAESVEKKKPAKKSKVTAAAEIPADVFSALHADTGELQSAGWNLPPGARYVDYVRPADAFASATRPKPPRGGTRPTVARFSLASKVPPPITRAIAVAGQVHRMLCSEKISNGHPIFTGANCRDHEHAHIFCESMDDARARITHLTVYAPGGFDQAAIEALRRLQWTWGFEGHDLRTVLHGIGQPREFDSPLFGPARIWRSLTPFVSTRHAKTFRDGRPKMDARNGWQEGSAAHDLLRLLALNPKWEGAKIRKQLVERDRPFVFGRELGQRRFRALEFQSLRHGGRGRRGHDSGAGFILEFPAPVNGPIALGYGAHFGLGLFVPAAG